MYTQVTLFSALLFSASAFAQNSTYSFPGSTTLATTTLPASSNTYFASSTQVTTANLSPEAPSIASSETSLEVPSTTANAVAPNTAVAVPVSEASVAPGASSSDAFSFAPTTSAVTTSTWPVYSSPAGMLSETALETPTTAVAPAVTQPATTEPVATTPTTVPTTTETLPPESYTQAFSYSPDTSATIATSVAPVGSSGVPSGHQPNTTPVTLLQPTTRPFSYASASAATDSYFASAASATSATGATAVFSYAPEASSSGAAADIDMPFVYAPSSAERSSTLAKLSAATTASHLAASAHGTAGLSASPLESPPATNAFLYSPDTTSTPTPSSTASPTGLLTLYRAPNGAYMYGTQTLAPGSTLAGGSGSSKTIIALETSAGGAALVVKAPPADVSRAMMVLLLPEPPARVEPGARVCVPYI